MRGRVMESGTIFLGGHRYHINGDVSEFLASQRPQKIILGDVVEESNPVVSSITWSDFRRGMGREELKSESDLGKSWVSSLNQRFSGHLVLNRKHSLTAPNDLGGDSFMTPVTLANFGGRVINAGRSTAGTYAVAELGASSGTVLRVLPGIPLPGGTVTGLLNGANTLAIATDTGGVDWTTDTSMSTWSNNSEPMQLLEFHRGMLFGMNAAGKLFFTPDLSSSWTQLAQLPAPAQHRKLREGPDGKGGRLLYISSNRGLHIYDNETEQIINTPVTVAFHREGGFGLAEWRGSMYYSAGLSVYRFTLAGGAQVVETVGLDRDGGVPRDDDGAILGLTGSNNFLFATVQDSAAQTGTIYRFADDAWDKEHAAPGLRPIFDPLVTVGGDGTYRIYTVALSSGDASACGILASDLPATIINPSIKPSANFESSGSLETPWVIPPADQDWTALSLIVDSIHPTSSETVEVMHARDFNSSVFTTVATKSVSGLTRYNLTDSDGQQGIPFRAFRAGLRLTRGGTDTNSPDVRKVSLIYRKNFTPLLGFQFTIDLGGRVEGRSAKEQIKQLREFFNEKNPQEFTFKDYDGTEASYYVTPVSLGGLEKTGQIEGGFVQLTVVQTIPNE